MKKYLAFYGLIYYPEGGMSDFIGDYDTIEDAINAINENKVKNGMFDDDDDNKKDTDVDWIRSWCHIWDSQERSIVYEK